MASIEVIKAVGREYWPRYFDKVHLLLKPGGRAELQIITIQDSLFDKYEVRTDFIQKYVFPGGLLASQGRLAPVVSASGLRRRGVERFGYDYAETLARWTRRFEAASADIARGSPRFDERFRRLWLFYLAYCEAGFRARRTDVIQLSLGKAS